MDINNISDDCLGLIMTFLALEYAYPYSYMLVPTGSLPSLLVEIQVQ